MIVVEGLSKRYGSTVVVDDVSFRAEPGTVTGFLGPNGAGKSTTLRMLTGLTAPSSGTSTVLGRPYARLANPGRQVGVLLDAAAQHPGRSGRAALRLDALLLGLPRRTVDEALARVGLTAAAGKRYRNYSLGMKQRLGLAAALLQPRDLLVLDEPTNGLDPQGTREVRSLVRELASDGTTVLVSSHLLAEIEQVATHVGIMSGGRLLRQGTLAEVLSGGAAVLTVTSPDLERVERVLRGLGLADPVVDASHEQVTARLGDCSPEAVAQAVVASGARLRGLAVERPDLEDLFVQLTGEGFDVLR